MLSRADKAFVQDLIVKLRTASTHGNSKATCWNYVGQLFHLSNNVLIDESRLYCSVCLESEKSKPGGGHVSKVASFSTSTSTANMNLHLSTKHNINDNTDSKVTKVIDYFKKYEASTSSTITTATSGHEFNRDLLFWFCRDLVPFNFTSKPGMIAFFDKNVPGFELPCPATLSSTALNDVYLATLSKVKEALSGVKSLCIMFDGWTDRYRARPYMGLRASFVKDWKYEIVTLSCEVLPSHTGADIAEHVMKVLKEFIPDIKKVLLSSCHDGAANMIKSSKLLKVTHYQHCTAHALHLLLTVDSIHKVDDLVVLLQKCRDIVTALHFKSCVIEKDLAMREDKEVIEKLQAAMSEANEIIELEDQFPLNDETESESETEFRNSYSASDATANVTHHHTTLKAACITRWNSALYMIESVLDLKDTVQNSLKRIGRLDLCLTEMDINLLAELRLFVSPFKTFTDIVSCSSPTLSLIPVMKMKIRKMCSSNASDDPTIAAVKQMILGRLDVRFPDSDMTKLHQLLDPGTKDFITRMEGTRLLEEAIQSAVSRQLIMNEVRGKMPKSL